MKNDATKNADNNKMKHLSIELDESEKIDIEDFARQMNMSVNELVIQAVRSYGKAKNR